jgi:Tfp pilus assembly protein PilO
MNIDLETIKQLRFEQIKDYYLRLSEREQYIVLGTTIVVGLIVFILIFNSTVGTVSRLKKKLANERDTYSKISEYQSSYNEAKQQVERLESLVNQTPASFSLTSHLENIAVRYGIKPDSMKPKPAAPNELYNEIQVEVLLQKVTLPDLTDYLYKIENSQGVIRLNTINIKPNYTDPAYLKVTFSVSAFTPKRGAK